MILVVGPDTAPALGAIRALGEGDRIGVRKGWGGRPDAGRYADAIAAAVLRGAEVVQVRDAA